MTRFRTDEEDVKVREAMQRRFGRLNGSNFDFTPTGRSCEASRTGEKSPVWRDRKHKSINCSQLSRRKKQQKNHMKRIREAKEMKK